MDQVSLCLRMTQRVLATLRVDRARCEAAARGGLANATELADYLVSRGLPFREAHEITGKIVRYCIDHNELLQSIPLKKLRQFSTVFSRDVYSVLSAESSLYAHASFGGTSPSEVLRQINTYRKLIK